MELFPLFLVFYLWIFGKLCYMLLLRTRNGHVLDLQSLSGSSPLCVIVISNIKKISGG